MPAEKLTKEWWKSPKKRYCAPEWLAGFPHIDISRIQGGAYTLSSDSGAYLSTVFWHEPDGEIIYPVGILYKTEGLKEEECVFCYHPDYVDDPNTKPISVTLPKRKEPYVCNNDNQLLFYFDNLVSEGWLGMAQRNAVHKHHIDTSSVNSVKEFEEADDPMERYQRLCFFGRGCHGAVSVVPIHVSEQFLDWEEEQVSAALRSGATIGGAKPKILTVKEGEYYRPAARGDLSTHISKLSTPDFPGIIENEYMNIVATRALLPQDKVVEAELGTLKDAENAEETVLSIKRFDRTPEGGRPHFEEALQIMNKPAAMLYDFSYKDLADTTRKLMGEAGVETLFKRLLAQFVLGNADGHLKNFAFWQKDGQWEFTPDYDLVTSENYRDPSGNPLATLALPVKGHQWSLHSLNPYKLVEFGGEMGLSAVTVKRLAVEIGDRIDNAKNVVMADMSPHLDDEQKRTFCAQIDRRYEHMLAHFEERSAYPHGHKPGQHSWGLGK
jgi:HipA-like protein